MENGGTVETTYLGAIREALQEEMRADETVFMLGEDIGAYGGAFKVTDGFLEEFGPDRVIDDSFYQELAGIGRFVICQQCQPHAFECTGKTRVALQHLPVEVPGFLRPSLAQTDFAHQAQNIMVATKFRQGATAYQLGFISITCLERRQSLIVNNFYWIY